jgi:FemAB-related protein (PEP-CTERM system-associated)
MLTVEVNPEISTEEWATYVESHPEGTYFHLPQWQAVIKESLGHHPFYIFARDDARKLCGVLPLFRIGSALTGSRLVSLPFSTACGPMADSSDTTEALVEKAKSLRDETGCRYLEIRTTRPLWLGLEVSEFFHTYVLDLSESRSVWEGVDRRARQAVAKARKQGVVVRVDDSERGLELFYQMNLRNKRGLGSPTYPIQFFKAMRQHMNGNFRIYLAEVEGKVVAGAAVTSFKGVTDYGCAASDSTYEKYRPNDAVTWQAIEDSGNEGCRCFDLGKTNSDNASLAQFKKKWGAEKKTLYYHYYPKGRNLASSDRYGIKGIRYELATCLWKRLPLPIMRVVNRIAIRHLD